MHMNHGNHGDRLRLAAVPAVMLSQDAAIAVAETERW